MKQLILACALLFFMTSVAFGQTYQLQGTVTDKTSGDPLPGVTVMIKGTQSGTQTGPDGTFRLPASSAGEVSLVFSFIGYSTQTVPAHPGTRVKVSLAAQTNSLKEVVAIGYGTTTRESLTGSVSSITAKELKDVPVATVAQALAGRLAGVRVTTTEGSPGAEIEVRVRGGNSITQDNSPLYIVDGVEMDDALDILSPDDIQSIDVLKDAASTAIYGARGSNGVVLITTKSGKDMKAKVSYNAYFGVRKIVNELPVMKPYDFVRYEYEQYNFNGDDETARSFQDRYGRWDDLGIYKNMPFQDWQKKIFGADAFTQSHSVTMTGGSKNTTYYLNLNNFDEGGIMMGSAYKRNMVSFKFSHDLSNRVKVGFSTRYSHRRIDGAGTSNTGSQGTNRLRNAVRYRPFEAGNQVSEEYTFDPDYALLTNLVNPVLLVNNEIRQDYRNDLNLDGWVSVKLTKQISFKSIGGVGIGNRRTPAFNGTVTGVARQNANMPVVTMSRSDYENISNSNTLTYNNTFNRVHQLNVLVGEETHQTNTKGLNLTTNWLPVDITAKEAFAGIQKATPPTGMIQDAPSTSAGGNRLFSLFGRVNYGYKSKYLATLNLRYDGSSKFAPHNRFGTFPSAALAWRISEEKFLKDVTWLDELKLRLSVGEVGNNRIGDDLYKTMYNASSSDGYAFTESVTPGMVPQALANSNLKWETTLSRNLGVDFSFFKDRLNGSVDVYLNNTKDLLIQAQIPQTSGWSTQYQNIGKTENKGLEIQLNGLLVNTRNFSWNASFNLSFNRNKIVSLGLDPDGNPLKYYYEQSGWVNSLQDFKVAVGQPIGLFYGYVVDGYYTLDDFNYDASAQKYTLKDDVPNDGAAALGAKAPQPGDLKLKKLSNSKDMTIGDDDKTVLGRAQPKFIGGLNQQFTYKNFDLSIFVNWSYGNQEYNANKSEYTTAYLYKDNNMLELMKDRWKWFDDNGVKVNDPKQLAAMNAHAKYWTPPGGQYILTSFDIEDASYLRISNVTLGYSLPTDLLKRTRLISRFRVYATVNNLWIFTKYSGFDPEASTRRKSPLTPGVDYAAYPRSRFVLAGVNVTF